MEVRPQGNSTLIIEAYNTSGNKTRSKIKETMSLYRANQTHVMMREILGQSASGQGGILPQQYIDDFIKSVDTLENAPRCIYLAIDPAGGGTGEMGIVALVETWGDTGPRFMVHYTLSSSPLSSFGGHGTSMMGGLGMRCEVQASIIVFT